MSAYGSVAGLDAGWRERLVREPADTLEPVLCARCRWRGCTRGEMRAGMYRPAVTRTGVGSRTRRCCNRGMSPGYGRKFEEALLFASRAHAGQMRKGTETPYITHLLAVAAIVGEHGGNEDEVAAALLHDAIEDTPTTREDIAKRFGEEVAKIVAGCSDADAIPKPPWRERKEAFIRRIRHASPSVRLVSAADKLHNARSILEDLRICGDVVFDRFRGGKEDTLWYYRTLAGVFEKTGGGPIAGELARVVAEIEALSGEPSIARVDWRR
jgi:hypothetical protein